MKKIYFIFCIAELFVFFLFFPNVSYAQNTGCCYYDDLKYCENVGKEQEAQYGADAKTLCKGTYFPDKVCNNKTSCQDPKCPPNKLCLQVPFPGSDVVEKADAKTIFPEYIRAMYRFAIWIAITLGIFMMMVGGFQWLTAGGSPDRVGKAKGYISNAITGIIIALFSFIILQTINPRLVELSLPGINGPDIQTGNVCCYNKAADQRIPNVLLDPKKNETCESALAGLYGPGWSECPAKGCCACRFSKGDKMCWPVDQAQSTFNGCDAGGKKLLNGRIGQGGETVSCQFWNYDCEILTRRGVYSESTKNPANQCGTIISPP